jgi:hypothetical protein
MEKELSLFERVLFEADGDPPDMPSANQPSSDPPDLPAPDNSTGSVADSGPPELDDMGPDAAMPDDGMMGTDGPPDLGEEDEFGGPPELGQDDVGSEDQVANLGLDDKVSAVMNMNLYQRFLALLNNIGNQLAMIKDNSDILHTLSSESLDIIGQLKKLDENIRLYLTNYFINENYSKNLLFFNKALNLLKLLNDVFDKNIRKGIRAME